jgi:hypothetical protein
MNYHCGWFFLLSISSYYYCLHGNKGVCNNAALPFTTFKSILRLKEELWKFKYFTMQKYDLQKNPLKETQNPSRYHNSNTNLKFQHKPKCHLSKLLI